VRILFVEANFGIAGAERMILERSSRVARDGDRGWMRCSRQPTMRPSRICCSQAEGRDLPCGTR